MPKIHAIADLHLSKIRAEDLQTLVENWPPPEDLIIVVGDTDDPDRLGRWPFGETPQVLIPGNTDPPAFQKEVAYRLFGKELAVLGCLGANWEPTPWAYHHLHDQPLDPEPSLRWIRHALSHTDTRRVILALHYPLGYLEGELGGREVWHPGFEELVRSDRRIERVLFGHVHLGAGEIPGRVGQVPIDLVSADRLGYRPKPVASIETRIY